MNNFYKKRIFPISIFTIIVLFTIIALEFFIIYEGLNGFKFVSKIIPVKNTKISDSEKLFIEDKIDDIQPIIDYDNTQITNLNDEIIIDIDNEEPVG
tara:strand:+ start:456 stop:746 length:291 start_codon:yes stop_codon:yes gene_type:complete